MIATHISDRNRTPKPFAWTATVHDILAKANGVL